MLAVLALSVGQVHGAELRTQQDVEPRIDAPASSTDNQASTDSKQNVLELPKVQGPRLVPPPPTIESPNLPSVFQGCWEGEPGGFDWVETDSGLVAVGAPGRITFCYSEHNVDVPNAEVRVSAGGRAIDWALHLGLGFRTFRAKGIDTDIFGITSSKIRGRTNLVIEHTDHWFYVLPVRGGDPSQVDWMATLTGPDTLRLKAEQVMLVSGMRMWGEWHADFRRLPGGLRPSS